MNERAVLDNNPARAEQGIFSSLYLVPQGERGRVWGFSREGRVTGVIRYWRKGVIAMLLRAAIRLASLARNPRVPAPREPQSSLDAWTGLTDNSHALWRRDRPRDSLPGEFKKLGQAHWKTLDSIMFFCE